METIKKTWQEQLLAPFPENQIEWKLQSYGNDKKDGFFVPHLTARAIMDRLDEVFGMDGWEASFSEESRHRYGKSKENDENKEISAITGRIKARIPDTQTWITKEDVGQDTGSVDGPKGGRSDALKRAAVHWGIGRYLYDCDGVWCKLDKYKKCAEKHLLKLPPHALPESERKGQARPQQPQQSAPARSNGNGHAASKPANSPAPQHKPNGQDKGAAGMSPEVLDKMNDAFVKWQERGGTKETFNKLTDYKFHKEARDLDDWQAKIVIDMVLKGVQDGKPVQLNYTKGTWKVLEKQQQQADPEYNDIPDSEDKEDFSGYDPNREDVSTEEKELPF